MTFFSAPSEIRLVDYLKERGFTRTKIKQLLKHRAIEVNGVVAKRLDHLLQKGDGISLLKDTKESRVIPSLGIRVVYEDDALIVTEKPAGLLTISTEAEKTKTVYFQLNHYLKQRAHGTGERVFIVHRLDRGTSGLILFAKSQEIKRILQGNWKKVEKRYYAVVEGTPSKKEGRIESYLSETKSLKVYSDHHSGRGKPAQTHYRVITQNRLYALLDILLETGRKHQIRVHLADIGHPVAGDKKYGARTDPFSRLGLHAYLLSFKHPVNEKPMHFVSRIPKKFGLTDAKNIHMLSSLTSCFKQMK
jgi:23S rRNA pseudouridine1911/1915/1917 synthase